MARGDITFEMQTERRGEIAVVAVKGRVTIGRVDDLHDYLVSHLDDGTLKFVLDLHEMEHIVSGGIGALVGFYERVRKAGGSMYLAATHPRVERIFAMMSLDAFFKIYDRVEEAVHNMNGNSA